MNSAMIDYVRFEDIDTDATSFTAMVNYGLNNGCTYSVILEEMAFFSITNCSCCYSKLVE